MKTARETGIITETQIKNGGILINPKSGKTRYDLKKTQFRNDTKEFRKFNSSWGQILSVDARKIKIAHNYRFYTVSAENLHEGRYTRDVINGGSSIDIPKHNADQPKEV